VGFALGGGCELALSADFRISAVDAKWGLPEILLGLIPAGGGTQRLTQLIGPARSKRMILTSELITATKAVEIGLVDSVVPAENVFDTALHLARALARQAPLAVRAAKAAINTAAAGDQAAGLQLESQLFARLFTTEDAQHGLESFVSNGAGNAVFHGPLLPRVKMPG
jgi:enoyl-CoA hydratase/carnithine racemase